MLLVAVSVAATVAAMATSIKTAHASRGCVAAEMRRAMLATVAAAAMLLVLLLFLVLVMLVIQDVRAIAPATRPPIVPRGPPPSL